MLSVSDTAVRPDDDRPGTAGGYGSVAKPATIGPDYPQAWSPWQKNGSGRGIGHYARRIAAPLMVLSAVALLLVGVANVQVARDRDAVDQDLATARVAASRVAEHLSSADVDALGADLDLLARSGIEAQTDSRGIGWAVADRADLGGGQIRALRRDVAQIAALAAEAGPLRKELAPLISADMAGASMIGPEGPNGLNALDDLARGLNRYATAAERGADPSAAVMGRAALAAGVLPTLAGAEGPRIWTVCQAISGPCLQVRVADARPGTPVPSPAPGTASPPGRRWAAGVDLLVVGVDPSSLFKQRGSFDTAAVFDLLYHLDQDPGSGPAVTVRSAVDLEQQAIDLLSRH